MAMWLELGDEPMVIETPPNVLGIIDDHWFHYVADFGNAGPDKGKGGKFLILPPGVDEPSLLAVEPDVADHAVRGGHGAGRQRDVADDGLGVGVLVVGVGVVHALVHQVAEAAVTEQVCIAPGQIAAQGVDGNLKYQPRWFMNACGDP